MRQYILIFTLLASLIIPAAGKNLNAYFSFCTFDQPGNSAYIETYLNVEGASVNVAGNPENKYQGKIEIQWIYKQKNKIIHFDKYNLLSPATNDISQKIPNFIDQQRVALPNGDYVLELKITDKNSSAQSYTATQEISIQYPSTKINISDIEFLESYSPSTKAGTYTKAGFDVIPLANNFFPKSTETLKFYAEIYNTKAILGDGDFLVTYNISGHQNKTIIRNLVNSRKQKTALVNSLIAELPLQDVSSGNYNVSIEVRDKSNNLVASKQQFFQRSNPVEKALNPDNLSAIKIDNTFVSYYTDKAILSDYISSLYPISQQNEVEIEEIQLSYNRLESMQQFFYYFWTKRNPTNPEQAWLDYQTEVNSVNAEFACPGRKGYESDRGRVYLQYGKPNAMDKYYFEGTAYPYEIWQYNAFEEQRNLKFVFLSRNLSDNCFDLIHSTAKGEFYDSNWSARLVNIAKSNSNKGNIDAGDDYSHRKINPNENFEHPK